MSKIYVANCSRQNQVVYYRLDYNQAGREDLRARFQPAKRQAIPPGKQAPLGGDLHLSQVEEIIKQLDRAHAVALPEIGRLKRIAKLCYSVDKPVPASAIDAVMQISAGIKVLQGRELRKKAAVAIDTAIADAVTKLAAEHGIEEPVTAAPTDVTFEQLEQSEAGEKTIAEGIHVRPEKGTGSRGRRKK